MINHFAQPHFKRQFFISVDERENRWSRSGSTWRSFLRRRGRITSRQSCSASSALFSLSAWCVAVSPNASDESSRTDESQEVSALAMRQNLCGSLLHLTQPLWLWVIIVAVDNVNLCSARLNDWLLADVVWWVGIFVSCWLCCQLSVDEYF